MAPRMRPSMGIFHFEAFAKKTPFVQKRKEPYNTANLKASLDPPFRAPRMRPSIGIFHFEGFFKMKLFVQKCKEPYNTANLKAFPDPPW